MNPVDTPDRIFVSVKEAARMLGITPWSVYEQLKDPECELDARYFGKRRLISVESIHTFAANLPTERPEESA